MMRKLGIYRWMFRHGTTSGGLLVDFSAAMTEPHYLIVIKPRWRTEEHELNDLNAFDSMVSDRGFVA